jgi:cytochrome c-type biogenesis protein CcmE
MTAIQPPPPPPHEPDGFDSDEPRPDGGLTPFTPPAPRVRAKSRRPIIVLGIVLLAIGFLAYKGLGDATTFFRNADEAVAQRTSLTDKRFRLQGTVVPGTIEDSGTEVRFDVEYKCVVVPVIHAGPRPQLFKPGIPVVVEGSFVKGTEKTFASDQIIVKHTEEYTAKESDRLAAAATEACPK